MSKQFITTPSHFFKLDKNSLWIWHDTFGDITKKEPLSEFTLKIMGDGNLHEKISLSNDYGLAFNWIQRIFDSRNESN